MSLIKNRIPCVIVYCSSKSGSDGSGNDDSGSDGSLVGCDVVMLIR